MTWNRKVFGLALPIILANLTVPLMGAVDTAVVGHLPDPAYIGAVAIGALIFNYIYWAFSFLRQSTTGLVAQAFGAEDGDLARAILMRVSVLALVISLALILLQVPILQTALRVFDASDAVEQGVAIYFNILIWAAPFYLLNYTLTGLFLGIQNMRALLVLTLVTNLANIAFCLLFVPVMGMKIDGVAYASIIAQALGCACGFWMLGRAMTKLPGRWNRTAFTDWQAYKSILKMGGDMAIRTISLLTAFAWFTAQGARFGDITLAANAILLHFQTIMAYGLDGFANAAETLSGQQIGKKDRKGFDEMVKASTRAAFGVALMFTSIYWLGGELIISIFTNIEEVRLAASELLIWAIITPVISVWSFQLDGIFMGATRTKDLRNMMVLSLGAYLALGYVLVDALGNTGLWTALMVFMALRGITLALRFPALRRESFAG